MTVKSGVIYSSVTGNTKRVAEAIFEALPEPKEIFNVKDAPSDLKDFGFVAYGFWVDKGTADSESRKYLKNLKGKQIALFGTLGAYPDSEHANMCKGKVRKLVEANNNQIIGEFLCQGKVDPKLIKWMEENMKNDKHHSMTPEREARLKEAEKHPDENDLKNAKDFCLELYSKIQEFGQD